MNKYYYNGKLDYEAEFLIWEKIGKIKEFYENGQLRFEDEYLYSYKLLDKLYIKGYLEYEGEFIE